MKEYVKPIVLLNEELAEGVFADGSNDCWVVTSANKVQDWNGSAAVFEIWITHNSVQHISIATELSVTFNATVTGATPEDASKYTCSFSGNTVKITRVNHANAYDTGDQASYKIFVSSIDEATTKALTITATTITCEGTTNVQGGGADGVS